MAAAKGKRTTNSPAKKRTTWIAVVTAIMKRQGKVLVGQRPDGATLARTWEFPGGKIELGESPQEALVRELKEELGVDSEIGRLVFAGTHSYGQTGIVFLFYEVKFWKGQIKTQAHLDLKWVSIKELKDLELPEANLKFLENLVEAL